MLRLKGSLCPVDTVPVYNWYNQLKLSKNDGYLIVVGKYRELRVCPVCRGDLFYNDVKPKTNYIIPVTHVYEHISTEKDIPWQKI